MSKKAVSLSLETIVIAIIILVVIILVLFFVIKYGGILTSSIGDQAKAGSALLPNTSPAP